MISGINKGSRRAWFAKVDKEGEPRGQKTFEFSVGYTFPSALIRTSDGGYLSAYSSGGLIKVDKDLNHEWDNNKSLYGKFPVRYRDVIESNDGFYAVTESHEEAGPALVKISKQGKAEIIKSYPQKCKYNDLNSLIETDDGHLIMVGTIVHGNAGFECSFSGLTNS